jgi:LysM repeat protein
MDIKQNSIWLVALFITTLTIAACVRPVPQPDPTAVPEQDPNLVLTQPAVQPEQPLPTPVEDPDSLPVATPMPVQSTLEPAPTAEPVQDQIHTVAQGDTLFKIASQYGVTIDLIVAANNITDVNQLEVGQQILIPAPGSVVPTSPAEVITGETPAPPADTPTESPPAADGTHVVQAGENLYRIGLKYGCSVEQMAAANGIANVSLIDVGQVLQVPDCN